MPKNDKKQPSTADAKKDQAVLAEDTPNTKDSQMDDATKEAKDQAQDSKESEKRSDQNDAKSTEVTVSAASNVHPVSKRKDSKDDQPYTEPFKSRVVVVTSGKGGVGKTTSAAAISTGLAMRGYKTAVIDFDIGLRNLDLIMGVERRVVYDMINVLHHEARLSQALIKDKNQDNLYILPASQTKDKDALSYEGVGRILKELSDMDFQYIICDSPAGIETGALMALYYADEAIVTTNPEVSSVRDSDRILGILDAKSRRAALGWEPIQAKLLLTRYLPSRVDKEEMMSVVDVQNLLSIPLLGVIPESPDVLKASNKGIPIIVLDAKSTAAQAYEDAVDRLLGNTDVPLRFTQVEKKGLLQKIFGK